MTPNETAVDCETIQLRTDDPAEHVLTVVVDRPSARNAMNEQVRTELKEVLDAIDDSDARAVVLTGSDTAGTFVSGADLDDLRDRSVVEQRQWSRRRKVYEAVSELSKPVVARINGHALGGGLELALACDIRVADEGARLGFPEVGLGLIPGGGGTQRLPRLVGEGQAMRLILTGDVISAGEARELGLVELVADDEPLDDVVSDLTESIAENSPLTLSYAKDAVKASSRMDLSSGIEYETELFVQLFATDDKDEGIVAFLDDREPEWSGQ
ncbi:enoyl-CoA hydratase/isomerase family protein [Haladaptatus sp. NG-SE-30]